MDLLGSRTRAIVPPFDGTGYFEWQKIASSASINKDVDYTLHTPTEVKRTSKNKLPSYEKRTYD